MGAIVVMVAVAGHVWRSNRIVVATGQRERNWHLWNDVIAYVDSGISSVQDDMIERLARRKAFEITGHTPPAPFGCSICGGRAIRRHQDSTTLRRRANSGICNFSGRSFGSHRRWLPCGRS
jgi:hypothetical protein